MENPTRDLVVLERYGAVAVTISDPRLPEVAKNFRVKPEKLLTQIQKYIPNALEQQIFVALAVDGYNFRPMKFAEILTAHRGPSPFTVSAFNRNEVSPGVFSSGIETFQDFVDTIISVIGDADSSDFNCSIRSAIVLVQTYGEKTEVILDSILKESADIWQALGKKMRKGDSQEKIASFAVNFLARKIIPACQKVGILPPLTVMDFFEDDGFAFARDLCIKDGYFINIFPTPDYSFEGLNDSDE